MEGLEITRHDEGDRGEYRAHVPGSDQIGRLTWVEHGGVKVADQSDTVSAILVDLSQRETQARSEAFANLVVREGRGRLPFREGAAQSAAFAVLKSPDLPSVLFESGYINNQDDAGRLLSPEGRRTFAEVTAQAIRIYFARSDAQAAPLVLP